MILFNTKHWPLVYFYTDENIMEKFCPKAAVLVLVSMLVSTTVLAQSAEQRREQLSRMIALESR